MTPIAMPDLGVEPGQIIRLSHWFAARGDHVYEGDRLVEVLVDGASFDVSSPATGSLRVMLQFPDDALRPGCILGWIELENAED